MEENVRCCKYIDCESCTNTDRDTFTLLHLPVGLTYPRSKRVDNGVVFVLKGAVLLDSKEFPNTVLKAGQFAMQVIGTEYRVAVLEEAIVILYRFDKPLSLCAKRYEQIMKNETPPLAYQPMVMCPALCLFFNGLQSYLEDNLVCKDMIACKQVELVYILNSYYPMKKLVDFYYPLQAYSNSFRYFVMQNYMKVKNVEDFAEKGGYSVNSFRRIFKNTFGEPVYQWMLKQKKQDIQTDLFDERLSISEIAYKFDFESLSHFSHFCRINFGESPRILRKKKNQSF